MEAVLNNTTVRRLVIAAAILAAFIVGALTSLAYASTPDTNGRINGCYRKLTGDLRVIDTAKPNGNCNALETSISWDQNKSSGASVPTAMGRIDTSGNLVVSSLKNVTSWTPSSGTSAADNSPGYCLEVPFSPYVSRVVGFDGTEWGSSRILLKNPDSSFNYIFDQDPAGPHYCPDAKYNVFMQANMTEGNDIGHYTFLIN